MRRNKYFDWEQAFHFIRQNADDDGIWHGNAEGLAEKFEVSEESAEEVLRELRTRRLVERLDAGTYFLSRWREK
jgi:hypothetical protein